MNMEMLFTLAEEKRKEMKGNHGCKTCNSIVVNLFHVKIIVNYTL